MVTLGASARLGEGAFASAGVTLLSCADSGGGTLSSAPGKPPRGEALPVDAGPQCEG